MSQSNQNQLGNTDYPWISYEEIALPSNQVDKDNYSNFKFSIYFSNFLTILVTVIPLLGSLTATILGAIMIADISNLSIAQTIISASTCFLTGTSIYFKKFGMDTLKALAPSMTQYIKVWIAGVPLADYSSKP